MVLSCNNKTISINNKYNIITSNGDFHCLNYLHFLRTRSKLESHKKVFGNKDFCDVIMPSKNTKILEYSFPPYCLCRS